MSENGWDILFVQESKKPYWAGLQTFVAGERTRHWVYPPEGEVLTALHLIVDFDVAPISMTSLEPQTSMKDSPVEGRTEA